MKNSKTNYVYLGGNHNDKSKWMIDFQKKCMEISSVKDFTLQPINPFNRIIDETISENIVERDIAILHDSRLTHVVLKSTYPGAILSTGTTSECIIACQLSKPVIIIGEPVSNKILSKGSQVSNNWYHPFVEYFSDIVVKDIYKAINWICEDIEMPQKRKKLGTLLTAINKNYRFSADDINPFNLNT